MTKLISEIIKETEKMSDGHIEVTFQLVKKEKKKKEKKKGNVKNYRPITSIFTTH